MRTWLFSSSTERPVDETMMRFILELERADSRLRARASTTTSLPSYPLTVMPPLTRLASTRAGREGSLRGTAEWSGPYDSCVWPGAGTGGGAAQGLGTAKTRVGCGTGGVC